MLTCNAFTDLYYFFSSSCKVLADQDAPNMHLHSVEKFLCHLMAFCVIRMTLREQGGWIRCSTLVPSRLSYSVILWLVTLLLSVFQTMLWSKQSCSSNLPWILSDILSAITNILWHSFLFLEASSMLCDISSSSLYSNTASNNMLEFKFPWKQQGKNQAWVADTE